MIATICSSVKRALRIAPSESGASLSRNRWSEIQGAGHVRKLQIPCARSSAWIEGFSSTQMTIAFWGGAMYSPTTSAALAANSGSLLSHQDLRPERSTFWARKKRQTYWTSTSPSAAASNGPVQRAWPLGGG